MTSTRERDNPMPAPKTWTEMITEVFELNTAKGWIEAEAARTFGESVALLHSEASEILENFRSHRMAKYDTATGKPDDVASEFADVLIRVLDLAGREGWDLAYLLMTETGSAWRGAENVNDPTPVDHRPFRLPFPDDLDWLSLGDHVTWLHRVIGDLRRDRPQMAARVIFCLVTMADQFSIDLAAEYERKMAYNWTRPMLHGGRTLR